MAARPFASACLASLVLAGCVSLEPHYQRPAAPVPTAWPTGESYKPTGPAATTAADIGWRDFFTDAKLRSVVELALSQNRDLRVALLNIQEARSQFREQRGALLPTFNAQGIGTIEQIPAASFGGPPGAVSRLHIYSAGIGVSNYELDLWGRVRNLTKASFEQYLASADAERTSRISIIAETANAYLTLAADRERLALAKNALNRNQESLDITRARFTSGIASELDVRQAETAVEQARAAVSTDTTLSAQDVNALNLLVGAAVPDALLPDGLSKLAPTMSDVPAGLSSTVLLQRPDVLEAEHQLKSYNANIGAARANFFPTIEITGTTGSTSVSLTSLFQPGTGSFQFNPAITLPIFDSGVNNAKLSYAKAQRDAAVAQYEKAIQSAFSDVANALAQRGTADDLVRAQQDLVTSSNGSYELSKARYERGVGAYLDTLTAEISLFNAEQSLVGAQLTRASNVVALYRALGGGVSAVSIPQQAKADVNH
ncbi:MAG TPA: efflux transporter outer membrane subunit [Caulobacteraceae bacterium]|jgi:multidrug efflux system outer membrane protein|nr:efflux transporter outer membrane subunit [Caulobacteraceae bacterium]